MREKDYLHHIKTKHSNLNRIQCYQCQALFPAVNIIDHMKCHGLRSFSCLYCNYGNDVTTRMKEHMHVYHPNKLAVVFVRNKSPEFMYVGARHLSQYKFSAKLAQFQYNDMEPELEKQQTYLEQQFADVLLPIFDIENEEKSLRINELITKFK